MGTEHHAIGQVVEKVGEYAIMEAVPLTAGDEPGYFVIGPLLGPELPLGPFALEWARHLAETANEVPK